MLSDYRKEMRCKQLATFLLEMVIPEDFSSDNVLAMSAEVHTQRELCEYFELGPCLERIMDESDFSIDTFLAFLSNEIAMREKMAGEDYLETQETRRNMTKGGAL